MSLIAELIRVNSLQNDKPFYLVDTSTGTKVSLSKSLKPTVFVMRLTGIHVKRTDKLVPELLLDFVLGKYKIEECKWVPPKKRFYFYVNKSGEVVKKKYIEDDLDMLLIINQNCYSTEEEAQVEASYWRSWYFVNV